MSDDDGEKTCPLCAEEMDLTDQQLKPCKCGYEICVWCWHHIMDMAEKDDTEGRCPACRVPYNKEKIVGTAANCVRLVAEIGMEKKVKNQKAKSKTSEGRKQLNNVRVIQRNLVYIMGFPVNLADEDPLQRKEYFGQYGKVMKVSISRTAAGSIQQFSNNTCSVYITYSKEEEAVRCIQSVHGFVLEGRPLRACFGTTKYCHAWLRNVPCSNPDCLYLHEIGSQEDSFTKDEVVSAFTRSRVQQITGATNNMQPRSGNVLPPPADDYCNSNSASGKPISRSAINNTSSNARSSPPNSSSSISVAPPTPASWDMHNQPLCANLACSSGSDKHKPEAYGLMASSSAVSSSTQVSLLPDDERTKIIPNEDSCTIQDEGTLDFLESANQFVDTDCQETTSETPVAPEVSSISTKDDQLSFQSASKDKGAISPIICNSFDMSGQACGSGTDSDINVSSIGKMQSLCSNMASISIDRHLGDEHFGGTQQRSSLASSIWAKSPRGQRLPQHSEQLKESSTSLIAGKAEILTDDSRDTRMQYDSQSEMPMQVRMRHQFEEDEMHSFSDQRLKNPEVVSRASFLPNSSHSFNISNHTGIYSSNHDAYGSNNSNNDFQTADKVLLQNSSTLPTLSNGYTQNPVSKFADFDKGTDSAYMLPNEGKRKHIERFEGEAADLYNNATSDMAENSIISNILSMDFETWDESIASPQNLARLLGKTDRQQGCMELSSSRKVQNSNQSRFAFAWQEESKGQLFHDEPSLNNILQVPKNCSLSHNIIESKGSYSDKFGRSTGFPLNIDEFDTFAGGSSQVSNKYSAAPRAQISAPPGFSMSGRAPPPGFTPQDRVEQAFHTMSGNNNISGNSSLLRNSYHQAPASGNIGSLAADIELMDPAILAVGKERLPHSPGLDMRSNFHSPSAFEDEARLQLLMQRSFSPNQNNNRFADMRRDGFVGLNDAFGIPNRNISIMEQSSAARNPSPSPLTQMASQHSRNGVMPNAHWDGGWNEVRHGNDMGIMELLRKDRLGGVNKYYYSGHDDSKFMMPSSGNLHNRTYGI